MNAFTNTHVTPLKTLLEHTQTLTPMETIRTIFEHVLYIGITLPLILFLLTIILHGLRELRTWAQGQQKESPNPVKGDHI